MKRLLAVGERRACGPFPTANQPFHTQLLFVLGVARATSLKKEPQETKYCMPNLLYTCNVRRGMQYWFLRARDTILM